MVIKKYEKEHRVKLLYTHKIITDPLYLMRQNSYEGNFGTL